MTLFAKIITGEIPCHRVYDDAHVLAFLDINPLSRAHTLVIPKERCASLRDLSDDAGAAIGRVLPRIVRAAMAASGGTGCNVLCNDGADAGQEVMHVHFHVIPRVGDHGLRRTWRPGRLDPEDVAEILDVMHQSMARIG
ncbi:MAG: HIT family protein [Phycisphaeraceae bacterium]|nr:HIT family protein [Phycisphaeraceae bacterium]